MSSLRRWHYCSQLTPQSSAGRIRASGGQGDKPSSLCVMGAVPLHHWKLSGLQLLSPSVLRLRHDDTVFRCDLEAGTAEPVPEGGNKSEIPSPDGALTLFAQEHNLHVRPSLTADEEEEGNAARPLTTDGEAHHSYGGPTGATCVTLSRKDPPQQPRAFPL